MASTANAFALLQGGGQPSAAGSFSKSRKKKAKKPAAADDAPGPSAAPAAPKPAPAATQDRAPPAPAKPELQTVREASASYEAAVVAAGSGELGTLALDWAEQVVRGDALFVDGKQLVDFKQVLLSSRALDALVESVCARGTLAGEALPLAQLLGAVAHPSTPSGFARSLADAAASLGQLSAADPLAPSHAAKRAATAALALLKRGIPKPPPAARAAEAPAAKLKRLGADLARQEARLGASVQPRELSKLYSSILELLCGQLDVLRPDGGVPPPPQAPELAAALRALEDLRAALGERLAEAQAPPKPKLTVEQQVAEAEAAHKKEEAAAAARLSEVEARIASLEAELAALKQEAGDIRERRSSAALLHRQRVDSIRTGKPKPGASPAEVVAAVQGGLGALDGLAGLVAAGGAAPSGGAPAGADGAALAAEVAGAEVPVKLLGAMQQVVELSLQGLAELGGKAKFYRERVDKAIKQGEQAAKLGVGDPKAFQQQRSTAEKNLKEVLVAAEGVEASCRAAVASYRERLPAMRALPGFVPPPPEYLSAMEARAGEAAQILEAIVAGTYVPPAPPAPAPAPEQAAPPAGTGLAAAAGAPRAVAAEGAGLAPVGNGVAHLEARMAALEAESVRKDAQIAAMVSSATLEVPSPLAGRTSMPPAMLSSPTSNKPIGPAAPIAPAVAPAVAAPAAAPAAPISFSQALAAGVPANGVRRPPARPRRA